MFSILEIVQYPLLTSFLAKTPKTWIGDKAVKFFLLHNELFLENTSCIISWNKSTKNCFDNDLICLQWPRVKCACFFVHRCFWSLMFITWLIQNLRVMPSTKIILFSTFIWGYWFIVTFLAIWFISFTEILVIRKNTITQLMVTGLEINSYPLDKTFSTIILFTISWHAVSQKL